MTTTDHAQEAARHIDWTHEWQAEVGSTEETNLANAMLAQAHAALAVAHELKTANLIAALSAGYLLGHDHEDEAWDVEIRTRLGLDGGADS